MFLPAVLLTGVSLRDDLPGAPHARLETSPAVLAQHSAGFAQQRAQSADHRPLRPHAAGLPAAHPEGHQGAAAATKQEKETFLTSKFV